MNVSLEHFRQFEDAARNLELGEPKARAKYLQTMFALAGSQETSLAGYNASNASADSRVIAAAGLARLLRYERGSFDDKAFSIEAFKIFDSVLGPVYKQRDLHSRDQTHLKSQAILDQLVEVTQPLSIYFAGDLQKDHVTNARQMLERFFRNSSASLLVLPLFAPDLKERGRTIEIVQQLDEGLNAHTRTLDDIEQMHQLRSRYDDMVAECSCSYYNQVVAPLVCNLLAAYEKLVGDDPQFQPTTLTLSFEHKRYPLEVKDATLFIRAIIRNEGPGRASDATITYDSTLSARPPQTLNVGNLAKGDSTFDLPEIVEEATDDALIIASVTWSDVSGTHVTKEYSEHIAAQRNNVDWQALRYSDPYSTEPVDSIGELVGRSDQIQLMKSQFLGRVMPSYFISGQKRVGKTSLAKTLCHALTVDDSLGHLHTIYLEGGDYIAEDGPTTIRRLCGLIRQSICTAYSALTFIIPDDFGTNLSDLKPFFTQLWNARPDARILIALDEFDELPFELFTKGSLSRGVFLALRSLSGQRQVGFAIIGSEKMALIMHEQGEHLNKWDTISLTYFDKRNQWRDFRDLIERPTQDKIDFSDDSIDALYDLTAGHPFFAKLLCRRILEDACERRLSYIDRDMVSRAAIMLSEHEEGNRFQHFFEDGIFAPPEARVGTIERRKRILLAAADLLRTGNAVSADRLVDHRLLAGRSSEVAAELESLERREILYKIDGRYDFKIRLFKNWLTGIGASKLLMELPTPDVIAVLREEQAYRVSHEELVSVCKRWTYRWRKITPEDVRVWLDQFGEAKPQRLMFTLLKHIRFYSGDVYRLKLQEIYRSLAHRYVRFREARTHKRGDFLVSYLDSPAKSGAVLAKVFADENRILAASVVEQTKLVERINAEEDLQAIICIDDFAGSGKTAATGLRRLWKLLGGLVEERGLSFHFIAISGFASAQAELQNVAASLHERIFVHVLDVLTDQDRAFSTDSQVFNSESDRLEARDIAHNIGKTLTSTSPLGFNSSEALVVFDTNCPNNSLPILWSKANNWKPLFERV